MNNHHIITQVCKVFKSFAQQLSKDIYLVPEIYNNSIFAYRYFDLSNNLPEIANNLDSYQENLLKNTYFSLDAPTALRWNHYIYFITNIQSLDSSNYKKAKQTIESDINFARKLVFTDVDIRSKSFYYYPEISKKSTKSISLELSDIIHSNSIDYVINNNISIANIINSLKNCSIPLKKHTATVPALNPGEISDTNNFLHKIEIKNYRTYPLGNTYSFKKVNLIHGNNGVGKTSLLEAIEYLYCGENSRSTCDTNNIKILGFFSGSDIPLASNCFTEEAQFNARNSAWYHDTRGGRTSLCSNFGKFNFFDTDAAIKLSLQKNPIQIEADISRLIFGSEIDTIKERITCILKFLYDEIKILDTKITEKESSKKSLFHVTKSVDFNNLDKLNYLNTSFQSYSKLKISSSLNNLSDILCLKQQLDKLLDNIRYISSFKDKKIISSIMKRLYYANINRLRGSNHTKELHPSHINNYSVKTIKRIECVLKNICEMSNLEKMGNIKDLDILAVETIACISKLDTASEFIRHINDKSSTYIELQNELLTIHDSLNNYNSILQFLSIQKIRIERLKAIIDNSSTNQYFTENIATINTLLKNLHSCNDFSLSTSNKKYSILRHKSHEKISISKLCTGQRTALALSLFISLNLKLIDGPPLIIFDDPISLIDDINTLSFFDILRSISLNCNRQLFFATSNEKIAGLFRMKFNFLGRDGYNEIHLTRNFP